MTQEGLDILINVNASTGKASASQQHHQLGSFPAAQLKMEELFVQWLYLDSTRDLIQSYLENSKEHLEITSTNNVLVPPPRSPPSRLKKSPHSLYHPKKDVRSDDEVDQVSMASLMSSNSATSTSSSIPRFYLPPSSGGRRKRAISRDMYNRRRDDIEEAFRGFDNGIPVDDFVSITKDLCGFPSFFNAPLFRRIDALHVNKKRANGDEVLLPKDAFIKYWKDEIEPYDHTERFFRLVKQPESNHIVQSDFTPILHELLTYHPGLDFLAGTPEFQEKYALTVVVRIFYHVDRQDCGRISLRDLRRSNLVSAFNLVDEEEDINKVNSYFSYEHFYVLYCKFWELDTDHDFSLSRDDLIRYGGHSLTRAIVDRIFDHGKRPFGRIQTLGLEQKNKLSYEDFIYFMLSEEDKGNPISLKYWFDLIDLNEDKVIRSDEMRHFYNQQLHRMECLGHEVVPFEDILCQLCDLLSPEIEGEFVFENFIQPDKIRIAGVFFNVLFNLSKFIAFEQRDPFLMRQQMAEPQFTDWDRYARAEYARLAMEEESREEDGMEIDNMEGWYLSETEEDDDYCTNNRTTAEAPF